MSKRIFISYFTGDVEKVKRIKKDLEEAGHSIWIYPHTIEPSDHIVDSEQKGIEDCDIFLLMLSKKSSTRPAVLKEIALVKKIETRIREKKSIIVKIDPSLPPRRKDGIQMCDLSSDGMYATELIRLLKKIENHKRYRIESTITRDSEDDHYFNVRLRLAGDLTKVREVDYHMHIDLAKSEYTVDRSENRASRFSISFNTPDVEIVYVVVRLKNGEIEEIRHEVHVG